MTTMIRQTLATDGTWTAIAVAPIADIKAVSIPGGWEVYLGISLPAPSAFGMPVTSPDGMFAATALTASDNVYARPFGRAASSALVVSGMFR